MQIEEKIKNILYSSLKDAGIDIERERIELEIPKTRENGDISTNIAMKLASVLKDSPINIAQRILSYAEKDLDIEKMEVANPGFINIFLSNRYYLSQLTRIVLNEGDISDRDVSRGQNIMIEYTDANPFKEFHIGHLYTNTVGESLARLQETLGSNVKRANYQGDVGLHVAKTLWGLEKMLKDENLSFEDVKRMDLVDRVKYLGKSYVLGAEYYDEIKDPDVMKEIDYINYYVFSLFLPNIEKRDTKKYEEMNLEEKYHLGREWCMEYFEGIYKILGTKFDYYFFESEVGEVGLEKVLENIGKVFEKDGPSIIYRGKKEKNLHTRVFVNKYGLPTYESKEIGLAIKKKETMDYDSSIVITADEQSGYFRVVLDALSKIDPEIVKGIVHIPHGKVKLPGAKKMSSRKGGILGGEWLINETDMRVQNIMKENGRYNKQDIEETSKKIAIAAIKYAFLKVSIGRDITFDIEKSITFDGDTGPYLLYVYSRCSSILNDNPSSNGKGLCLDSCLSNSYTKDLVKAISEYEINLYTAANEYSPSILCQYLFDLAQKFNSFYQNVRVTDAKEEEKEVLLLIVKSTMSVMKNGLKNLGIDVVERM